jgi:hypothetical protein
MIVFQLGEIAGGEAKALSAQFQGQLLGLAQ